jgi:AraC family transcriptional regulator
VEVFRRGVGVPPHQYLLARRVERAREPLAQTDLPVADVALEVGFASGQHFARVFRRLEGCSPREHRRRAA